MHPDARTGSKKMKAAYALHIFILLLGVFTCIAGTYAVVQSIVDQYKNGQVGGAFQCADNSGTVTE